MSSFRFVLIPVLALAVAASGLLAAPRSLSAQEGGMQEARSHFKEGKKLYDDQEFEKAAEEFLEAYELSERGELLYNIGQSYRKAGDLQNAEKYFQKYLNENPDANNEDEVVDLLIQIQQKLAAQMATIDVQTEQSGLQVFVGDEEEARCETPCSISVAPGERTVRVSSEDGESFSETMTVEKTETRTLEASLGEERPSGGLDLRADGSGGEVTVVGGKTHSLPLSEPLELASGEHTLRVTGASGGTWEGTVTIEPNETTRLLVPTGDSSGGGGASTQQALAWGLTGTSVALIAGGVLFGQNARRTHEMLATQQTRSGAVSPDLLEQGRRQQTTANLLVGAGATTLLTGAGLFAWDLLEPGR